MDDSILNSIKKTLGIGDDYTVFDNDIIMHINSVFSILNQLGVGPKAPFKITDDTTEWSSFIGDETAIELVKSYMYFKVRMMFDPPTSGILVEAMNKNISEAEWRLNAIVDPGQEET